MTDAATDPAEADGETKKKGGLKPLLFGLVLAVVGAGAGFFAGSSGLLGGGSDTSDPVEEKAEKSAVFVDVTPIVVSIARPQGLSQLRLNLSLEVDEAYVEDVTKMMPRLLDVLNSYLRAVDTVDISDAATLVRLRAQMLRRIQVVTGGDAVRDLLIQEFVVN